MNSMPKWLHSMIAVVLAFCLLIGTPVAALATDAGSCGQAVAEKAVDEAVYYCDTAEKVVSVVVEALASYGSIIEMAASNPEQYRSMAAKVIKGKLEDRRDTVISAGFDPDNDTHMTLLANEVYDVAISYYNDNKTYGEAVAEENAWKEVIRFALVEVDGYSENEASEAAVYYYDLDQMVTKEGRSAAVEYVLAQQEHNYQNGSCKDCGTQDPNHVHNYESVTVAPTCTEGGYTTYTCTCGDTYVADEIAALGHAYEVVVTAPTCTEGGYTTYTCACGDTYVADEVAALGHTYEAVVTAATCTEGGYTTYTCACGDTYVADEVPALGHSFTNYVSDNNATCTEDSTQTAKCDRCDVTDTVTEEGTAKGHTYTATVTEPTCTKGGYTTHSCECGDSYITDKVAAFGHSYETEVVAATCTRRGHTAHTCTTCGHRYLNAFVDATGHTFEDGYCTGCGCEAFEHIPGDINGDGEVNNKDLTRLFQYLSDWDVEIVVEALDVNGDGSVNNKDLTRLFQYLSDWDVEIF